MPLINLILNRTNQQDVKEHAISALKDHIHSKPVIENELKRIYEEKQLQPRVYVVSRAVLILIQILSFDYKPRSVGLSKLGKQRIVLCKDDANIERSLMHEVIHLLGIKSDMGIYSGFDVNGVNLTDFNEICTEYLNRHWIFEDPIRSIKDTYPGPYTEIDAFVRCISVKNFSELYFESPGNHFIELLDKASISKKKFAKEFKKAKEYSCYSIERIKKILDKIAVVYEEERRE